MTPLDTLLANLDIEQLELNLFRGHSPNVGWNRVYGGLVIAQSLRAALKTVEGRRPHSLHGYFLLGGDPKVPIIYDVDRIRDGRSFTTRRVVAIQHGQAIFAMSASFQLPEEGLHHQIGMPDVPRPEDLPDESELMERYMARISPQRQAYWGRKRPMELRPCDPDAYFLRRDPRPEQQVWFRTKGTPPADQDIHACLLAYATDMTILDGTMIAHGKSLADPDIQPASLDHSLWFHAPVQVDDWLLYAQDSPWTGNARGIGRGLIYSSDGRLVASVAQEGLVRQHRIDLPNV